jgi:hypothetical protein
MAAENSLPDRRRARSSWAETQRTNSAGMTAVEVSSGALPWGEGTEPAPDHLDLVERWVPEHP